MLNMMSSILPDGGAEPKPQTEGVPLAVAPNRRARFRAWRHADATRADLVRSIVVLVTLLAGGWFLLRGFSPNNLNSLVLPYPAPLVSGVLRLNLAAIGCGLFLLVVSIAIAAQRAWAWPLLLLATLVVGALAIAATVIGGVVDWAGFLFAFFLLVTAAHPAVRFRTIPQ
jgi:hypothetical protein